MGGRVKEWALCQWSRSDERGNRAPCFQQIQSSRSNAVMYLGAKASARQGKHGWVGWFGDPNERVRADTQSGRKAGWEWEEGSRRKRKEAAGTGESPMGLGGGMSTE